MDVYDDRFYGFTRRFMISVGLWPYQNPNYRKAIWVFVSMVYIQGIIFQYMTFITRQYNLKLFIELMSFNTLLFFFIVKYNTIYMNFKNVKFLLEQINSDFIALTDTQEIKIIQTYASKGRMYTVYSGMFVYLGVLTFLLTLFVPDILDFVKPLDEPRLRQLPTPIECFIDQQKYFYVIVSDICVIGIVGSTTLMASETMFLIVIRHACGLFTIASYRINHAFDDYKNESVIKAKLIRAIRIHGRSLEFIKFVNSCFSLYYLLVAGIGVLSLSVNLLRDLFQLFQAIESKITVDIYVSALYVCTHFSYIFWVNYFGQDLSDHSEKIFKQTYNTRWYKAPLRTQKLLFIILQRSSKTCTVDLFSSLQNASMEGFASIVSLSVSYFTVLYSM
ncbi:odorant receptor 22c-like isoform X2 [Linepithema humile]|uniref:odorant receptor 22c-like isoform X2 n=1 Tax=Linepithema humile TaxID=83485 RepID=UPI00351E836F